MQLNHRKMMAVVAVALVVVAGVSAGIAASVTYLLANQNQATEQEAATAADEPDDSEQQSTDDDDWVDVPEITGLSRAEAEQILTDAGLTYKITTKPVGGIKDTVLLADRHVKRGEPVQVIVRE